MHSKSNTKIGIRNRHDPNIFRYTESGETIKLLLCSVSDSYLLPVKSRLPQGNALGSLLFLVFINDLPDQSYCLFADDTNFTENLTNLKTVKDVQENINTLQTLSNACLNKFHAS